MRLHVRLNKTVGILRKLEDDDIIAKIRTV